jgi:hypothetical protein
VRSWEKLSVSSDVGPALDFLSGFATVSKRLPEALAAFASPAGYSGGKRDGCFQCSRKGAAWMKKARGEISRIVPADIRAIVGDADEKERRWIASRLAAVARRIQATVPARKKPLRKKTGRTTTRLR